MRVGVVQIRAVIVRMGEPGVTVRVRVLAGDRRIVEVIVMAVVVAVRVVVLDRLVNVGVVVTLGDVEVHSGREQRCRADRSTRSRCVPRSRSRARRR